MPDILAGETFVDGQSINGARLNNHVNGSQIQPEFVGTKSVVTAAVGDYLLLWRAGPPPTLRRATIQSVNGVAGNVTSVGLDLPDTEFTVGPPVTSSGNLTASWKPGGSNAVLGCPANGSFGAPSFRHLVPQDIRFSTLPIPGAHIDWNQSNRFSKNLTGTTTFLFDNVLDGLGIYVAINHNPNFIAHWPGNVLWPGGTEPLPNAAVSIFKFEVIGGNIFGWLEAANCHL